MAWFQYKITREDVLEREPDASEQRIQETIDYWNDPKRYAKGLGRSALQGVTFGYGDELTALAGSWFGGDYGDLVEGEREALEKFRQENPELAYGIEIATGLVIPGVGLAKSGLTAGKLIGRGALTGGVYGSGAGEGDVTTIPGAISRTSGAVAGALLGGTGSYLLPKAAGAAYQGVKAAKRQIGKLTGSRRPQRTPPTLDDTGAPVDPILAGMSEKEIRQSATELNNRIWMAIEDNPVLKRRIEQSGMQPLQYIRRNMDDRGMVADIPGLSRYLRGVVSGTQRAGERAERVLGARQAGEYEILMKNAERLMGTGISRNADQATDMLKEVLENEARPLYRKAYWGKGMRGTRTKNLISSDEFESVMARDPDLFKEAYEAVAVEMRRKGRKMLSWDQWSKQKNFDIESLHRIKRWFDGEIGYVQRGLKPEVKPKGGEALETLKNDFNDIIKTNSKLYADANKRWSVSLRLDKALIAGRSAANQTAHQARKAFDLLQNDMERIVFRSAILQALETKTGTGTKNLSTLLTRGHGEEGNRLRQVLEATFPDRKSFVQFIRRSDQEQQYRVTESRILQGSRTAPTEADIRASGKITAGELGATGARAAMNPMFAVGEVARKVGNLATALKNERLRRGVAELAFHETPQQKDQAFRVLMNMADDPNDQKILFQIKAILGGAATPATQAGPGLLGVEGVAQPMRLLQ